MKTTLCLSAATALLAVTISFSQSQAQILWTQHPSNPILVKGGTGEWDRGAVLAPSVIVDGDTLRMWYTGLVSLGNPSTSSIGLATSVDGVTWTKYAGNPVMTGRSNEWDRPGVGQSHVIADGDTLRMWYAAGFSPDDSRVGYAISVDGINWNRHTEPVLTAGQPGEWNRDLVMPGSVVKENGLYKMWFSGGVGSINPATDFTKTGVGYATSPDGINWTVYDDTTTTERPYLFSDPVLDHGFDEDWDANEMFTPSVLKTTAGYELWYSGWQFDVGQHIGYATSPEGVSWTKHDHNPVFASPLPWTSKLVFPDVHLMDDQYHMWFQGWLGFGASIGYATAPVITSTDQRVAASDLPDGSALYANYPNPFRDQTTIGFRVSEPSDVMLRGFNVLGQPIATLASGRYGPGEHRVRFAAGDLPAGLHFYQIEIGSHRAIRKMIRLQSD